jgi:hypothetical protein
VEAPVSAHLNESGAGSRIQNYTFAVAPEGGSGIYDEVIGIVNKKQALH